MWNRQPFKCDGLTCARACLKWALGAWMEVSRGLQIVNNAAAAIINSLISNRYVESRQPFKCDGLTGAGACLKWALGAWMEVSRGLQIVNNATAAIINSLISNRWQWNRQPFKCDGLTGARACLKWALGAWMELSRGL
jgi:hypothetical protein